MLERFLPRLHALTGANPVLWRELRVALRNERAFALMAVYVAILGAIVAANFPSQTDVTVSFAGGATRLAQGGGQSSGQVGEQLFWTFFNSQVLFVLVLLPALSSGALAQERERQTLEPLLLAPLTPLQIVWGKAVGVLAFAALLLLATVPLTSLCFLLGGVSPGQVISAYVFLLGLAACITAFGLWCSAKWQSATQATVACYGLLPFALAVVLMFAAPGSVIAGVFLLGGALALIVSSWRKASSSPHRSIVARIVPAVLLIVFLSLLWKLLRADKFLFVLAVFIVPYLAGVARMGMDRAASELSRIHDPRRPSPERWRDFKNEWQTAVAPPPVIYLPSPNGSYTYTPQTAPPPIGTQTAATSDVSSSRAAARKTEATSRETEATYGVKPFLPDNRNPVFARDLRAGLLGKFSYLLRFSYVAVIGTELMLGFLMLTNPGASENEIRGWFGGWATLQLGLLMIAGAVFGARALAPEREQQTLPQLLTTPLSPSEIVGGKMMAVAVYTLYIFVLGVPMALLLPALGVMQWSSALIFLVSEFVFGAFAAALGLFCSLHGVTVRRALGWATGSILALMMANILMKSVLIDALGAGYSAGASATSSPFIAMQLAGAVLLPFTWLQNVLTLSPTGFAPGSFGSTQINYELSPHLWRLSILLYGAAALFLTIKTARDFRRYTQTV